MRQQLIQSDAELLTREWDAGAHVRAPTEGKVLFDVLAAKPEFVRRLEHSLVAVRGSIDERDRFARLDPAAVQLDRSARGPREAAVRRVQPQEFLDRIGNQLGMSAQVPLQVPIAR